MPFPTTGVLDSFGDTEGPPMTGWSTPTGVSGLRSASGVCLANAANGFGIWNSILSGADEECFCTVTTACAAGGVIAVFVRFKDISSAATSDGYGVTVTEAATDSWTITIYTNGTPSTLGAGFSQEVSNGDKIGIRCIGSSIQAWYCASGGSWTMLAERTDTTYAAAGYIGAAISDTTGRIDDFGGGNYVPVTLTLGPGAYTLTGAAGTLVTARKLTLTAGAYTQNGGAASVLKTSLLNLGAGAYTYTGAASALSKGLMMTLAAGSYALSGAASTLVTTRKLTLAAGAYSLTGQGASLLAARTIALNAGTYTASGAALTALWARVMALNAGAYTQSGAAALLLRGYAVTLTAGGYVLTGLNATLTHATVGNYTVNLEAGSYSVTGNAATLEYVSTPTEAAGGVSFDSSLTWKLQLERLRRIREDEELVVVL